MARIKRAILSCYDKMSLVELARLLRDFDVEIISTSGTLKVMRDAGVDVTSMEEFTGVEELMDGRVRTFHPKVHAGLLGDRDNRLHAEQMLAYELQWIDLVVMNLKPLDSVMTDPEITSDEVFEQTNIGGAAMIRSAAKNFRYVTAMVNPENYPTFMHEMRAHEGEISFAMRHRLAKDAFYYTAAYDRAVGEYLAQTEPPAE
jgi:phosphoribosylaminoimidazolecarboxamide formyltransferase/IMP cyclohydrolase